MLDMLGADKKAHDSKALAAQIMKDVDTTHDGKISKGLYFLQLKNYIFIYFNREIIYVNLFKVESTSSKLNSIADYRRHRITAKLKSNDKLKTTRITWKWRSTSATKVTN